MSALWIAVLVLSAPPADADSPGSTAAVPVVSEEQSPVAHLTGHTLRQAVHATLRRWALPPDEDAEQAARQFLALYDQLQRDTQLAAPQREQLRGKVRGRLLALSGQISKQVAVRRRLAESRRPKSVNAPDGKTDPLAQQFGGLVPPGGGFGQGFAHPGGGFGGAGFGGQSQQEDDHGQELVELIQQTIAPHTWDVNGGNGSIYYWRPGRAMVVRQQGEVHEHIGDVLDQLRRAGR